MGRPKRLSNDGRVHNHGIFGCIFYFGTNKGVVMKSKNLYILAIAIFILAVIFVGYGLTIQCKESSIWKGNFVSCANNPGGR